MAAFITFEGGEGTGKTTQARLLAGRIQAEGHEVVALREPGGTPLGDYLREWLKSTTSPLTPEAELLLFTAARAELVRTVIKPALDSGQTVVLDRYADSTTVYQGHGRGLPMQRVRSANELATGGLTPSLTVLLDAPVRIALDRAFGRADDADRRFEREDTAFHRRIRAAFKRLARRSPDRWLLVDATLPEDAVHEIVWQRAAELLAS